MVHVENAENELAMNVFCYGHAGLFDMYNSTVTLVNTSLDYIVATRFVYELSGGSCDIIGSLRVYGTSLKVNSGRLTAYGRIAFGQSKETMFDSAVSLEDKIEYVSANAKRKMLFNCDSFSSPFNAKINYTSTYIISGRSWKWKDPTLFYGTFTSVDVSEYSKGYLHFYVYCSDITKAGTTGQIEITSSGNCDQNEYGWQATQYITKTGWNEIWIDMTTAQVTGGAPDLTKINYFRIYLLEVTANYYIDEIEFVTD
jgi:hypothetical protein